MDLDTALWPAIDGLFRSRDRAGAAVAVLRDRDVVARGFGVRDLRTGAPVSADTMFHVASVSKPFVATAIASLCLARPPAGGRPALELDAPITSWIPEFTLADGRQGEVTARTLLSHTSGLPDVTDYGWHDPELDDAALERFARSLADRRLTADPGTGFAYCNAGYELLGLLVSRVVGPTFEAAVRQLALEPFGLRRSTFLRAEVPADLASAPHVGMPVAVPGDAYPYSRRHAPSSTLHSNVVELCRWLRALLDPAREELLALLRQPVAAVGDPPWEESMGLGWFVGTWRGRLALSHTGADAGFGARLVLLPQERTGVAILANSNTVPTWAIAAAALDVALGEAGDGVAALGGLLPSGVLQVAETLAADGEDAAVAEFRRLAAVEPAAVDLDDDEFAKAVWGAIELHRTDLVRPLLRVWASVRPESSQAQELTRWADRVEAGG